MHLHGLLTALTQTETFRDVLGSIEAGHMPPNQHILRAARPFVAAALAQQRKVPMLIVAADSNRAYNIAEQIPAWLPEARVSRFVEASGAFYDRAPWSEQVIRARLETLGLLFLAGSDENAAPPIVVASGEALMQKTLPLREYRLGSRHLRVGQRYDPEKLLRLWHDLGYEAVSVVSGPGHFSRRGGIVDVFPPTAEHPVRIEYFDDEIESLRQFETASQRSLATIEGFDFAPAREAPPKHGPRIAEMLADWFMSQPEDDDAVSARADFDPLENGASFPLLEFYLPWMYTQSASLLDYLPEGAMILSDDWDALSDSIADIEGEALARHAEKDLPPDMPLPYHTWDALSEQFETLDLIHLGRGADSPEEARLGDLFLPDTRFGGQIRHVIEYLHKLKSSGEISVTVSRQAEHLAQIQAERDAYIAPINDIDDIEQLGSINFVSGELGEGWVLQEGKGRGLHLLTDAEIFGWKRPEPRRRQRPKTATPESFFADLSPGDFVVHVEHGIARFGGLIRRTFDGQSRELLQLEYAENDLLFVPIHQAERITKYVGTEGRSPKLNRLGTQEWIKLRKKASDNAEEIAAELLALYAKREVANGHAFSPDAPWQHELEASFPYIETEDQLSALRDVKRDMESSQPMDRLICGDVGYGKTEIALRAAFKATMDGKQVALLVPTTILAAQHYQTFSTRLEAFPVKVEMLSRFRSESQQTEIISGLADGSIDIVIGTHRLLQQDIRFKDLALIIIDEEQRFGITHKEQLKHLRAEVDVLTLTATPIPRTLYMSITGVRDISIINTAPDERLPVATHVGVSDDKLIRSAILREIDRGGQVYVVHNRVRSIETVAKRLRDLVPEASFAVGHGQLDERTLENVMTAFSRAEYDVLVSTSIIESGLDIPNANTIIVDRSDWFGLADLYQLRGRVGRSANQAYAYFFHPTRNRLTDDARTRLETISEETQLGAGLSIAMRDLELRGAGDMLGKKQSGHIAAVGFHLYTQLLSGAVRKLKADTGRPEATQNLTPPLTIDLPLPAYFPPEYIPETALRLQLYRRLADMHSIETIEELRRELEDRFGPPPPAVQGLVFQLRVKLMATFAHATAIVSDGDKIGIKLPYLGKVDRYTLQELLGDDVRVSRTAIWITQGDDDETWMLTLLDVLEKLGAAEAFPVEEAS